MTQTTRVEEKQNRFLQYVKRRAFSRRVVDLFCRAFAWTYLYCGRHRAVWPCILAAASISGCNAHYALAGAVLR